MVFPNFVDCTTSSTNPMGAIKEVKKWDYLGVFPKLGVPFWGTIVYLGLYWVPLFRETTISSIPMRESLNPKPT